MTINEQEYIRLSVIKYIYIYQDTTIEGLYSFISVDK